MTVALLLLAFLAEDKLASVFHALPLVRFGAAETADLRGDLADLPLVDAGDGDFRRLGCGDRHSCGNGIHDVVAVPERKLQVLAGDRRLVTDAVDLELLLEPLGDAADQILHLGARRAPHGAGTLVLTMRRDMHIPTIDRERNLAWRGEFQFALGAFDGDRLAVKLRGDAGRNDDGLLADTGHCF